MAQKKNHVTVELKKFAKKDPRFYLHAQRVFDTPSYSSEATFTVFADFSRKVSEGPVSKIDVPGFVGNGNNDEVETYEYEGQKRLRYTGVYRPDRGYWSLWGEIFRDLILTLPDDAEIKFQVSLDGGTSELHCEHRLHTDRLYLLAEWQRGSRRVRRQFLVATETGYHNTARFGFGSPKN